jgi:RecA/RadA recombinase
MSTPIIQLQSAFEHFNEYRSALKMTTGSPELDSIIDSIQQGQFYLFYGTNRTILDGLVYGLLVNCILPIKEHGFDSMALYINNVDYYHRDKSNILSAEKIAIAAKCKGIDPTIAFKNIFIQIAYNESHQLAVAKQVAEFIESKEGENIRLLVINNLTKFFRESKDKNRSANVLKEVLGIICKACAKHKVAIVCSSNANITNKGVIARPIGGTFLKHIVNTIVNLKENQYSTFKATLVKHQYVKTPKSAVLYTKKVGKAHLLI